MGSQERGSWRSAVTRRSWWWWWFAATIMENYPKGNWQKQPLEGSLFKLKDYHMGDAR